MTRSLEWLEDPPDSTEVRVVLSPEVRAEMFPKTPEEWAEKVTADIYDCPAIETREEFKQAMIRAFSDLRGLRPNGKFSIPDPDISGT